MGLGRGFAAEGTECAETTGEGEVSADCADYTDEEQVRKGTRQVASLRGGRY
jgi:hypothetical protein